MSHGIEHSDEQYETLRRAAEARGETPDRLLAAWIDELGGANSTPHYYETDDWLRHLGVSEERIRRANAKLAAEEAEMDADSR
jgi:hypothetical protein